MAKMLVESDVVDAVCLYVSNLGYMIQQRLPPTKQGVDIIATRENPPREVWIEAKGETSERKTSERYGEPFDSAQVNIHVAEAVYTALKHLSAPRPGKDRAVCIALPSNALHHRYASAVTPVLLNLGVILFWVKQDKTVTVQPEGAFPSSAP